MFDGLAEAIEELEIPVDGRALAAVFGLLDRLEAKVSRAVGEIDAAKLWEVDGATSMTAWLRQHARRTGADAHGRARTAARLRRLPCTRRAWEAGSLSSGQIAAVMANVADRALALYADGEAELVPTLCELTSGETVAVMRAWAARADALLDDGTAGDHDRAVYLSKTLSGRRELSGSLDPEGGAVVERALRLAETPDRDGEPARRPARRRGDALVDVCRAFLERHVQPPGRRHRPHLNVIVTLHDVERRGPGTVDDGTILDGVTIERLLCDANLNRVVTDGRSTVLDYGSSTRTASVAQFAALVVRDRHCRFGDCDRGPEWCDAHHLQPFEHGGPTDLDNLTLACTRHHHLWHRPGWHAKRTPDGTVETTGPDGRLYISRPPP